MPNTIRCVCFFFITGTPKKLIAVLVVLAIVLLLSTFVVAMVVLFLFFKRKKAQNSLTIQESLQLSSAENGPTNIEEKKVKVINVCWPRPEQMSDSCWDSCLEKFVWGSCLGTMYLLFRNVQTGLNSTIHSMQWQKMWFKTTGRLTPRLGGP